MKSFLAIVEVGLALLLFGVRPVVGKSFLVFDGLVYSHKPDLGDAGLLPIRAASRFWAPGASMDEVDVAGTRASVAKLSDYHGLLYIDVEHWPVFGAPPLVARANVAKLIQVADLVRDSAPGCTIGYYSVLPERIYWPIIQHDEATLALWRKANLQTESVARHVDVVFPSLYTFYNDPQNWVLYARSMLKEARRYGKPVYVFLWPEFESDDPALKGRNIPTAFWRQQLELCHELADGIVLWGGWREEWDANAAWWNETKRFIESIRAPRSIKKHPASP